MDHKTRSDSQPTAPFDVHYINFNVFAVGEVTNESVLVWFSVNSLVQNFNVHLVLPSFMRTNYTYDPGTGPITAVGETHSVAFIEVKRSPLAQAFTTCLLIIGWALTSVSV